MADPELELEKKLRELTTRVHLLETDRDNVLKRLDKLEQKAEKK